MRILILSVPRSGSTTMFKSFQNGLDGFNCYNEPWHISKDTNLIDINSYPNLLIKSLIYQQPNLSERKDKESMPYQYIDSFEFYEYLIPKFDKVILLDRIDKLSAGESYHNAISTNNWYDKWESTNENVNPQILGMFLSLSSRIKKISDTFDLKVWNYEDLFYEQNQSGIISFVEEIGIDVNNVDSFLKYYDSKNKLRMA